MCFIFHKWSKWTQYDLPMSVFPGILAPKEIRGKALSTIDHRQKRTCKKCGKVQDELIYEN